MTSQPNFVFYEVKDVHAYFMIVGHFHFIDVKDHLLSQEIGNTIYDTLT